MEIYRYLAIFGQRKLLIAFTVIAAIVAAYSITPSQRQYLSTSLIYVGKQQLNTNDLSGDKALGIDRIVATYAAMIRTEPIARLAIERTGLDLTPEEVIHNTYARNITPTFLLAVSVTDDNPVIAQTLANAVADAFVDRIQDFEPLASTTTSSSTTSSGKSAEGALPALPAYVFQSADLPTSPASNDALRNLILGAVLGLIIGCAAALALDYLDITIKSVQDVEYRLGVMTLGVIPRHTNGTGPVVKSQRTPGVLADG